MASVRTATGKFTSGETVNAYRDGDTTLAAATTAVAASDGSVTFANLIAGESYLLIGQTSGNRTSVFGDLPLEHDDLLPGVLTPSPIFGIGSLPLATNLATFGRFTVPRRIRVDRVHFRVQTADTADNPIEVGIYQGETKIATTGVVTGQINATGVKVVNLTAPVILEPGTVYYSALSSGTITTSCNINASSIVNAGFADLVGSDSPLRLVGAQAAAHPLPATAQLDASTTTTAAVIFLREVGT